MMLRAHDQQVGVAHSEIPHQHPQALLRVARHGKRVPPGGAQVRVCNGMVVPGLRGQRGFAQLHDLVLVGVGNPQPFRCLQRLVRKAHAVGQVVLQCVAAIGSAALVHEHAVCRRVRDDDLRFVIAHAHPAVVLAGGKVGEVQRGAPGLQKVTALNAALVVNPENMLLRELQAGGPGGKLQC